MSEKEDGNTQNFLTCSSAHNDWVCSMIKNNGMNAQIFNCYIGDPLPRILLKTFPLAVHTFLSPFVLLSEVILQAFFQECLLLGRHGCLHVLILLKHLLSPHFDSGRARSCAAPDLVNEVDKEAQ